MANTVTSITNLRICDAYEDDHTLCTSIQFTDQDGNDYGLVLGWTGEEGYAAARYAESSPEAMTNLLKFINDELKLMDGCSAFDDHDNEESANDG